MITLNKEDFDTAEKLKKAREDLSLLRARLIHEYRLVPLKFRIALECEIAYRESFIRGCEIQHATGHLTSGGYHEVYF